MWHWVPCDNPDQGHPHSLCGKLGTWTLSQTLADVWLHARRDSQWQPRLGLYLDLKWLHSMLTSGSFPPPSPDPLLLKFSSSSTSLSLPYLNPILSHCKSLDYAVSRVTGVLFLPTVYGGM